MSRIGSCLWPFSDVRPLNALPAYKPGAWNTYSSYPEFPQGHPSRKSYFGILCFNSSLQLRLILPLCFLVWTLCFDCIVYHSSREVGLPFGLENLSVLSFELEMILLDHLRSWCWICRKWWCLSLSEGRDGEPEGVTKEKSDLQLQETAPGAREERSSTPW